MKTNLNISNNARWLAALIGSGALALASTAALSGCERHDTPGEAIDDAIDDAGDAIEDAGDAIEDAADDAADNIDDATDPNAVKP